MPTGTDTHAGKSLPGDTAPKNPTLPPLPGEGQPARTGKEVPTWWSDPQMAMDIVFALYAEGKPKEATKFWTEYLRLRG